MSRNAEILTKYQNRFRYIFVDEYQDTNHAQYRLIKLLAAKYRNICVVGDDDQSIYRWRGADIQNILNFEKDYPEAKVVKLEQNYRSTQVILDAAYSVIKSNSERKDKRLWTEKKAVQIDYFTALDEEEEAFFVSREIKKRVVNGERTYADFAVLCRTTAQFRVVEENFIKNGIKYQIFGGMKFYSRKEIKDTLAYLKAIANPDGPHQFSQSRRRAPSAVSAEASWQKISQYADENDISITLALLDALDAGITGKAGNGNGRFCRADGGVSDII